MVHLYYRTDAAQKANKIVWVIVYLRESQKYKDVVRYFSSQESKCKRYCKQLGLKIHKVFKDIIPGTEITRPALTKCVEDARINGYAIVVLNMDRLLRGDGYHGNRDGRWNIKPSQEKLQEFLSYYEGVDFYLCETDAEIKAGMTKRGQASTRNRGGGDNKAGRKKRRKEKLFETVVNEYIDGLSYREIHVKYEVPKSTLCEWVREYTHKNKQ